MTNKTISIPNSNMNSFIQYVAFNLPFHALLEIMWVLCFHDWGSATVLSLCTSKYFHNIWNENVKITYYCKLRVAYPECIAWNVVKEWQFETVIPKILYLHIHLFYSRNYFPNFALNPNTDFMYWCLFHC